MDVRFKVPDLRGRVAIGAGDGGTGLTLRIIGDQGGSETVTLTGHETEPHTLTIDEIPPHDHVPNRNQFGTSNLFLMRRSDGKFDHGYNGYHRE